MRIGDAMAETYVPLLEAVRDLLEGVPHTAFTEYGDAFSRVCSALSGAVVMLDGCSDPGHVAEVIRPAALTGEDGT
jgi:hypothetical protein